MFDFAWPSDDEDGVLRAINSRDWRSDALLLGDADDEHLAARAVALGAVACHGFGNFYAISTHPSPLVVRYVNQVKGRPADQVGSVTTIRKHIPSLFDWSRLPEPLTRERVLELMDRLFEIGPFGFRGPAAPDMPEHLTSVDCDIRTTQLIGAGYRCPSRRFMARCLERIDANYLYITSANQSHFTTGKADEPAHFRLQGLQKDFGHIAGVLMLAHRDESRARLAYPHHVPSSTTILAFHRARVNDDGVTVLQVERHGSLQLDHLRRIAGELRFAIDLGPLAHKRLPVRDYADAEADVADLMVA